MGPDAADRRRRTSLATGCAVLAATAAAWVVLATTSPVAWATDGAARADAQDQPTGAELPLLVTERATASVGMVRSAGGMGSGWIAAPDTVVTNLHVARGGTGDIYLDFPDGERVECYTVVGDREMDLAVLKCETGTRPSLPIDIDIPIAGTPVAVTGYPEAVGPTTTHGVITGHRQEVRGISTVGFTAAIEPGSSGSPVYDAAGQVRAVATFGGGLGVPIGELVPAMETAEHYPPSKAGAEWRLRLRRAQLVAVVVFPLGFLVARQRGRPQPARAALRWTVIGVLAALVFTQGQFMLSGPVHFL